MKRKGRTRGQEDGREGWVGGVTGGAGGGKEEERRGEEEGR